MYHVSQRTAGKLFCLLSCLDIRSERFKAGTVLNFRHSASPIAGAKPSEIEQRIPQIVQALNIQDVLGKYPYQMSGGQQQRVAAARAMVTNPAIVLADEPTGALDSNSSRMLLTMLTELNERLSATILMVTHDAFSASYCNRILFVKDGQVFNELHRGTDTRKEFFTKILEVVSVLGGEQSEHIYNSYFARGMLLYAGWLKFIIHILHLIFFKNRNYNRREMKKVKEKFLKLNPFGLLSCILSVRRFTHGRR